MKKLSLKERFLVLAWVCGFATSMALNIIEVYL